MRKITFFDSDTERVYFTQEWEKTRKQLLEQTKGRIIILQPGPPGKAEYNETLGFIAHSKVGRGRREEL